MVELSAIQISAALVLLAVIGRSLLSRPQSALSWTWIAFCTSAMASLLLRAFGESAGPLGFILLAPVSATCGLAWLLARALFRDSPAIGPAHIVAVAIIAAINLAPEGAFGAALGGLQSMLASTVIILTLWEAAHGWRTAPAPEKLVRAGFLGVTGAAVLVAVIWLRTLEGGGRLGDAVQTAALLVMVALAGSCVAWRRRFGAPGHRPATAIAGGRKAPKPDDPELRRLGERLDALVRTEALFLDGDLKVADLARKLQTPDYKITRAITGPLDAQNFNRYINRYRVEHACRLMRQDPHCSILAVAFDSGFASIGPFNRAFKASTGRTPRDFRAALDEVQPAGA